MKTSRPNITDLIWLVVSIGTGLALINFLFNWNVNGNLDYHYEDTYIVMNACYPVITVSGLIIFLVFFMKDFSNGFRSVFSFSILMVSGTVTILGFSYLLLIFYKMYEEPATDSLVVYIFWTVAALVVVLVLLSFIIFRRKKSIRSK